jgi:hypothetical protein
MYWIFLFSMQLGKSLMIAGPAYNPFDSKAIKRAIYGFGIPNLYYT